VTDGSPAFERIADELERRSGLSRLETRGTLRLALKEAGLVPKMVTSRSMIVVIERLLPVMLARRGVRDAAAMCSALVVYEREQSGRDSLPDDSPESVFSRLAGARPRSLPPPPSSERSSPPSSRSALQPPSSAPGSGRRHGTRS
jgi:hypothetical protein